MSDNCYDAIIIGAGHNGLVTAAYLAKRGLKPLVLESRAIIGGCSVTEEVWPAYRVSTAAYLTSLMQPKVVEDLELKRHGYAVDAKNPSFFSPFPDGRCLFFWQDERKTLESIAQFSKRDAERFRAYENYLERIARIIEPLLLVTPPNYPPAGIGDGIEYLRLLAKLARTPRADILALTRLFTQSATDFLDEWFESDELKATLATDAVIGANGGPHSPGSAYVLLHHCMGGVDGKRGLWGFVRGGMGSVSNAIASSARARGTEIRTKAPVEQILVRDGRVCGVVLANGDELESNIVASCADPHRTFLGLVPRTELDTEFTASIRRFRSEGTSCKINFALSGLPKFKACPETPGPQHRATMHICPSVEYIEKAWDDAKYGRPSARPLLELTIPTSYDPSLAPEGKHIMGCFIQYAPYTLRDTTWDEQREPFADRVIDLLEEEIPNIRSIIIDRQVLTPLDLEQRFGIKGGNIFHGEMSLDQMFVMRPVAGWASYRTPIRGLYLCGSGAHPGGGVMGAPGHNAAREILRDL